MSDRLSIANKLVLMLVIPIAGLFVFSTLQTSEKLTLVSNMERLDALSGLALSASHLAHQLQKERGRTAGVLSRDGAEASELARQRALTDEALSGFRQLADGIELGGDLARVTDRAKQKLADLANHRSLVSASGVSAAQGTAFYTDAIAALISMITVIAGEASTPSVAFRVVSLDALVRLKEMAGQERAILMARFSAQDVGSEHVREIAENGGMQRGYEQMFLAHASEEAARVYREKMTTTHVEEVERMRGLVLASARDLGVLPSSDGEAATVGGRVRVRAEDWWRVSTSRIDGMFEVEEVIQQQVRAEVAELRGSASWALVFFATLAVLSILGAIALSFVFARGMIRSFTGASDTLQRVVSQISGFVQQQSASTNQTASSVSETTTTVEEIRKTAETADASSREMSGLAQQSRAASSEALDAVAHGTEAMQQIRAEVESIAQNILELSEKNIQIGEIVQTVNAIAEQSNLLAVNASIEAAKAGEHGRGFSVVAAEVKALAQQSKEATDQIRSILSEIQKSSNAAVMITEQGVKRVEEGAALIEELGRTIQNLSGAIQRNADAASQISLISTQQLAGIEQITEAMRNIGAATTQNVEGARQLEETAGEIHAVSARILQIVRGQRAAA
ncbi:MAG: nitrate- and nitrite sensing domain-containing protein [Myxococcales bacterium]|nr:nitrate- and nitrite sensing domain-containing protein [Myxococcales bacterium]